MLDENAKYAIISCSGGLDSTSLLLHMLAQDLRVKIVNFNYGSQQNKHELKCLKRNLKYLSSKGYDVDYMEIDISKAMNSFNSSLLSDEIEDPKGEYTRENQKIIFVPNRNTIFANIIFGHALTLSTNTGEGVVVGLGIHKSDNKDNSTYPDCTPEWADAVYNAFKVGNFENKVTMYNPYQSKYKKDVLEDGIKCCKTLGLSWKRIYKNTLSCYNPTDKGLSCGECPTCIEENQKVLMSDNTLKPIKDVKIGDEIFTLDEHTKKFTIAKVTNVIDNGIKPVYDMNGLLLTDNHKVYIKTKNPSKFREYKTLNRKNATYYAYKWHELAYRTDVDEEKFALGYMRGFVDGDGHIGNRSVFTCQLKKEILEEFWCLYNKYITESNTQVIYDENRQIYIGDGGYSPLFDEKTKFDENSKEYMRGYLNGMIMADGCLSYNKNNHSMYLGISQSTSANHEKCDKIDKCLSKLGIKSLKWYNKCNNYNKKGCDMKNWYIHPAFILTFKYGCEKKDDFLKKMNHFGILSLNKVKVDVISEPVKEAHVYDITTTSGTFICEGYLVHNCIERLKIFDELNKVDPAPYKE